MRCPTCDIYYLPSDTRCVQCGAALTRVKGDLPAARRGVRHHFFLSSGGYLWEYRDLRVPLDLTFVLPSGPAAQHRSAVEQFNRAVAAALEEAAAEGWEADGPLTWEDLYWMEMIEQPWWDRLKDLLGLGAARRFRAVTLRLRRPVQAAAAANAA